MSKDIHKKCMFYHKNEYITGFKQKGGVFDSYFSNKHMYIKKQM